MPYYKGRWHRYSEAERRAYGAAMREKASKAASAAWHREWISKTGLRERLWTDRAIADFLKPPQKAGPVYAWKRKYILRVEQTPAFRAWMIQRQDWLMRRGKLPASLQTGEDMTGLIGSGLTLRTVYENAQGEKRLIVSVTDNVVLWKTADPELPAGGKSQGSATLASFRRWIASEHPASGVELEAFDKVLHRRKYAQQTTREIRAMKNRIRQER
ncbi:MULTISPECIES: hypothetical protein [Enterobacterales]|uniref:ORF8 n=1 Tax=Erwinia amylovora TaxID=552 RepID=Q6TFY8_ERWAM|nr:hypothetical protein [Erwinia amylovora]AAQ97882.1 ORF8 [Erwinia amylovora]